MKTIGVLALQGGVIEHIHKLERIGAKAREVRFPEDLTGLDGIILPGGESTCITKLLYDLGLAEPLRQQLDRGLPAWGTCAGAILLSREVDGKQNRSPLGILDMEVVRNAYGAQLDSFIHQTIVREVCDKPVRLIFIRAPRLTRLGTNMKPLVQIPLARQQNQYETVAAQSPNCLVTTFHPELDDGTYFHEYFVKKIVP